MYSKHEVIIDALFYHPKCWLKRGKVGEEEKKDDAEEIPSSSLFWQSHDMISSTYIVFRIGK